MTLVDQFAVDDDGDDLTPSDRTYVEFRRHLASGMLDAGFDLTPSKSAAIEDRSGQPLVDQSLFRHVLNGAAFGARLNHALTELAPEDALSQDRLLDALRLFAVHDFHKTEPAQRRRERSDRRDGDKDVPEERVRSLVDTLGLDEFEDGSDLSLADYEASVLAAEETSGRHRSTASTAFFDLRWWVRSMDAAAGLSDPSETGGLQRRIGEIAAGVELHHHRVDDTKGIATNLLNTSLADRVRDRDDAELLVYFADGALYLTRDTAPSGIELLEDGDGDGDTGVAEDALARELSDEFVETVRSSDAGLDDPETLARLLDDSAYQFGYYKFTPLTFLFGGVDGAVDALRSDLVDRTDPNEYSVYTDAVRFAVGTGLVDEVPASHEKPQILGVFVATLFDQLFKRALNGGATLQAITDVAAALGVPEAGETVRRGHRSTDEQATLTEAGVRRVADAFDESVATARESVRDVTIGRAKKTESQVLGLAFLAGETDGGVDRAALPLGELLDEAADRLLGYYREWQDHWDDHRGSDWDSDRAPEAKCVALERTLQGNLTTALPWYVRRYVRVDGDVFGQPDDAGGKFDAYDRASQARICLTCNDRLVGESNALDDYSVSGSVVGRPLTFTHFRTLDPANETEISSPVCPLCELEFTLRNAVHGTNTDDDSRYLFLAPDYFHSPVDAAAARALHDRLSGGGATTLQRIATELVGKPAGSHGDELEAIYEELVDDRAFGEYLNYDSEYGDGGGLGLFRLDPQSRPDAEGDVNRTTQWTLDLFAATAFAWLTGSRVILTDSPIPSTRFDETAVTVTTEGAPAVVQRRLPTSSTISFLTHTDDDRSATDVWRPAADDAETAEDSGGTLHVATDFGAALYHLAALTYVTNRAHGIDFQRLTSVLDRYDDPCPGADTVLKRADEAPVTDRYALFAATLLDDLIHPTMSDSIRRLAEAGFEVVRPDTGPDVSNYEYERLFRAARDALTDRLASNASQADMIDIVAGVVMESGSRTRQSNADTAADREYADARYTREPAERFAEIFVEEVYEGICDGDFYELRRLENSLASGYNAAIRRHQAEYFESYDDSGDSGDSGDSSDSSDSGDDDSDSDAPTDSHTPTDSDAATEGSN